MKSDPNSVKTAPDWVGSRNLAADAVDAVHSMEKRKNKYI